MKVSLTDACRLLGQSARQVRYRIRTGDLVATKEAGRWMLDDRDLAPTPAQKAAAERKVEALRETVAVALGPRLRRGRPYSVRDMRAFDHGVASCRAATTLLGQHPAAAALSGSVVLVSQGCHRFAGRDKATAFRDARERAAEAVALLHLDGQAGAAQIADAVEQDYLPVLGGEGIHLAAT